MTWIRLLTEEPALQAVVRRMAPAGTPVRVVSEREARQAASPAAVVIASSGGRVRFITAALDLMEERSLTGRTVVLAPFSRELATALVRRRCPHVIWLDAMVRELPVVLRELVATDLRYTLSEALLECCGSDPLLQRVVRQAFRGSDCPTTVSDLAARAHCTPSTLRAHWRRSGLPESPQALVEWAVLAVLAELRSDGSKISSVSRLIGLHETTLYRAARRRLGVSPSLVNRNTVLVALEDWLPAEAC